MSGENITIHAEGGIQIRGILKRRKNGKYLIVFIHGLGENSRSPLFKNASEFFFRKGFSTFIFDLYGDKKKQRKFSETTFQENAQDIEKVMGIFQKKYRTIDFIAHSLGAIPLLLARTTKRNRIVLWDPSREPRAIFKPHLPSKKKNYFSVLLGHRTSIHKKIVEGLENTPKISRLVLKCCSPIKVIGAEQGGSIIGKRLYYKNAHRPKAFELIAHANHNFDGSGTRKTLFNATLDWLEQK